MATTYLVHSDSYDARSKNARAQARHREKRKAYVRTLEDTLSRLQVALGVPFDQAAVLPSPLSRIRDLERENQRLRAEVQSLRRHVTDGFHTTSPQYENPGYVLNGNKRFRPSGDSQPSPLLSESVPSTMPLNPIRLDNNLSAERLPCIPFPPNDLVDQNEPPMSSYPSSTPSFPPPTYPTYNGYVGQDCTENGNVSARHSPASPAVSTFTRDEEVESQLSATSQPSSMLPTSYQAIPIPQASSCAISYGNWTQALSERRTIQFSA